MSMIPHLEMDIGTFFPEGGMESITMELVKLAERQGVQFHYSSYVSSIIHEKDQAKGIQVNNHVINADVIVANMDIFSAYAKLLKNLKAPKQVMKQERSSSALIFYWFI